MRFTRFAIYYTPPEGSFAHFGAQWLGWDILSGKAAERPTIEGLPRPLDNITQTPRRYGFHATIKPPFHLAAEENVAALCEALGTLSFHQKPFQISELQIVALGSFLALVPTQNSSELSDLAARTVHDLDRFRAPLTEDALARRRQRRLTPTQEQNLARWGYPHVMDQYRFHMTLTGRLAKSDLLATQNALEPLLAPLIPQPFTIDALTLAGEDDQGMFHQIHRYPLSAT